MNSFNLKEAIEILELTPDVLTSLFDGLSDRWIYNNEGGESWSPFEIVGHLIHGEKHDWILRAKIILEYGEGKHLTSCWKNLQSLEMKTLMC